MRRRHVLKTRGLDLALGDKTVIMGILNVTPDSFSDGGRFLDASEAIAQASIMLADGAGIIDIGGESTRPGSTPVSAEVELARILPVIDALKNAGVPLSVDTWKSEVAAAALDAGAHIINDITALQGDPEMAAVIKSYGAAVCLMHNAVLYRGREAPGAFPLFGKNQAKKMEPLAALSTPDAVEYYLDLVLSQAADAGIDGDHILLDPGFGFGVSAAENMQMFSRLPALMEKPFPWLVALSRKRFVQRLADPGLDVDLTTAVLGHAAVLSGAHVLRVHDVKLQRRYADMADSILSAG